MIEFSCPNCGDKVVAPDGSEGQNKMCLGCKRPVTIPQGASRATIVWMNPPFTTGGAVLIAIGAIAATIGLINLLAHNDLVPDAIKGGFIAVVGVIVFGVGFLSRRSQHKN